MGEWRGEDEECGEDMEARNEIVVYQPDETVRPEVRLADETVWLNQARLGELFGVDRKVVNRHIHNIYKTGELEESATCAKIAQVQKEGARTIERAVGEGGKPQRETKGRKNHVAGGMRRRGGRGEEQVGMETKMQVCVDTDAFFLVDASK